MNSLNQAKTIDICYQMFDADLAQEVLAKRVIDVQESERRISLDDGTELLFHDEEGCCAWFEARLTKGKIVDDIITSVVRSSFDSDAPDSWSLQALSYDQKVFELFIEGDRGHGHSCSSITLEIVRQI